MEAKASAPSVSILMRHHGWMTWTRIAIEHEAQARKARRTRSTDPNKEFEASVVAITAVAFALDALFAVAKAAGIPDQAGTGRGNRGRKVAEVLKRGTSDTRLASTWTRRMDALFAARRKVVHFGEENKSAVWDSVLQSYVAPEIWEWRLEVAQEAVNLLFEVLDGWQQHPRRATMDWAQNMTKSIVDLRSMRIALRG